jgi:serine/threonine protein kinase
MSEVDSAPNAPCIQVLSAILHDIGASEYTSKFTGDDQDDESIIAFSVTKPHKIANRYGLSLKLATAFVDKCCIAVDAEELASAIEHIEKCRLSPAAQQQSTAQITAALSRLNFHIISELGKGAFGTVFKCKSRTDKRTVAVKIVNDPKNSKEALREGQRLVNCRHPNIVCMHKVHDIGKAMCALEMEVICGGDLLQHLEAARQRPERRLPKDVVIRFSRQLLDVLYYLHERSEMRMLHGDIKPQNILVTGKHPPASNSPTDYSNADIKIADFGLAKTTSSPANTSMSLFMTNASTKAGMFKGTMWYMSPEALQGVSQGRERCFADDLWSACLVILEMDTGLTLQQLMTAPGAVNMDEMLTKASVHLLPLLFSVFFPGPSSRGSSAKDLLRILDDSLNPLFEWTFFETSTNNFVPVHPAVAFVLEECFASCQQRTSLSLKPPLDLNFDISPVLKSATAMGIQTQRSTGSVVVIRRTLKSSVLTSGTPIPVWQELIGAREWLQCDPSTCAKLDIDDRNTSASPDPSRFRRVILQPSSIDNVQIPHPLKSEPYLHSAQAADIACMTARIHDSLPEWDILEMLQIINPTLQSKYADYRHRAAARSNGNPNERMLFHFAPDFVIPKIWQEGEGHDPRLSNWAEVGKGSYFSEHLMYGYAYNFKLWPSPSSNYMAEVDPECGTTFRVFATLVCLGNIADMGPGCETCPSDAWNAWKREFAYQKSPDNPSPKPTRPPIMPLPQDDAHKQHLLNLMQVKDAPRYDSIVSTEGDLATHSASTNKAPSGKLICDIMHPRLKMRAREWGQQYVVFDTAASYPMFLITLKKTRESPKVYEDGSNIKKTIASESSISMGQSRVQSLQLLRICDSFFHSIFSYRQSFEFDNHFVSQVYQEMHLLTAGNYAFDLFPSSWPVGFDHTSVARGSPLRICLDCCVLSSMDWKTGLDGSFFNALRKSIVFMPIFSAEKKDGKILPVGSLGQMIELDVVKGPVCNFLLELTLAREFYLLAQENRSRSLFPCSHILPLLRSECVFEAGELLPKFPSAATNAEALSILRLLQIPDLEVSEELRNGRLTVHHVWHFFRSLRALKLYQSCSEEEQIKTSAQSIVEFVKRAMSCDDLICSEAPFIAERNLFVSNCPDLSTDQLHSKLQGLNIVSMQSLTLRNSGVDHGVLDFCCRRFRSLTSLDISDNSALVSIPPSISMLTELRQLGVSKCVSLQSFPDELPQSLKVIDARDCPSIYFPPNFIVRQGCEKILQCIKDARKSKPLRHVKVLFLGDPRSGKTSFLQALAKLPLKPGADGPDESLDVEERLKSDTMDLFLQNVPELCFFDFSRDIPMNAALDIISFHRQTVFVICFSVLTKNPQSEVIKWLEMIASSRICWQQVRFVIIGTKIDLITPSRDNELKTIEDKIFCHICARFPDLFEARSRVRVMFVTSIQTDPRYTDLRREFKRHIITMSKSIFEGPHAFLLRVPDMYKDVLDSVDALKKRVKPGMANVFRLQSMVESTLYGQLAGAHKDSLKLDALKMLHDLGELVFVDSDTSPCIILKPQLMFRIFSTFFDPVCKFAKVLSREAIRIPLQSLCVHQAAEVSETLFDFLLKLRVFSEVASCTNAAFQPELKSFMISVSNNTRPLPNSWAEVLSSRSASCIRGLRVFSEKGIISFTNFNYAMTQLCVDPSFMWAFAFYYLLDNDTACFVRLTEHRSFVDIVFLSNDVSNISGVTVEAAYRRVVQLLSCYPLPPLPLCPYCCATDSFVRFGEAHICHEKELQDPLHCIQNREAGTESAQTEHAVHGSSITIYCSRNHQFCGSYALTGLNVGSIGVGKHVTFPGESAERDALGWISVSNLGLANTATGMVEVMPGSFFSVSGQLKEGEAINLKSLTTIEDALRSGAETCSVQRFGATVGEESSDLVVRLKYSVGDSILGNIIDMVLSCSCTVEVKTADVSKCSVITKEPHKLSRGDEVLLSVSVDSIDGSKVWGVLCLVANVIDDDHIFLERRHPQGAAPLPLRADVRIIPMCASFTPLDNVIVMYQGSGTSTFPRPKFDLFPGSSNNFEIFRLVSSDCSRATEAACWRDVEDNWVSILGNDSCNFEITGMTLFRCRERERLFLEEVNHLRNIAPLRPQPDFKCPFDQSDLEKEKRAASQQQVMGHFSEFSQKFSLWPQADSKDVNVCAAWWGMWPAAYYNVAQNGIFNLPPHLKIDPGYFGEGFYLTRYPRYTDYYLNGFSLSRRKRDCASQLMCYAALGRPYPVTQDPFLPPLYTRGPPSPSSPCGKRCGAACNFSSADGIDSHDCHYAPVKMHPYAMQYFPCPLGMQPDFDEIVVFNSKRILASAIVHYQRRWLRFRFVHFS